MGGGLHTKPVDLVRLSLDERVLVQIKGGRELDGTLHAFDQHLNMVLGDVNETIPVAEDVKCNGKESAKVLKKKHPMLFVRGDSVVLVAPPKIPSNT